MTAGIGPRIQRSLMRGLVPAVLFLLSGSVLASTDAQALHVLNRLAFGPAPGDVRRVAALGVDRYIRQQLHPDSIPLPAESQQQLDSLETLTLTPTELFEEYGPPPLSRGQKLTPQERKQLNQHANVIVQQAMQARVLRAVESPRQLQEVMVNFWFNHFNVFRGKGLDRLWVGSYEEQAIRPYALGHFRDLLFATAKHPAMLFYLDNWLDTQPGTPHAKGRFQGINENYARELMELHTLGVNGGYTQTDVTTLAHVLTGWGLCPLRGRFAQPGTFCFDPQRHDFSDQVFLGRTIPGGGEAEITQALDMLASSPATAHHISYELAQYFTADNPDPVLVDALTKKWMQSDGDIAAVLDTLFHSPQFWSAGNIGNKFKTPYEYVISMLRATGEPVTNVKPLLGMMNQLGMPLYGYLTPDGYKNTADAWLDPDAMMMRLSFATALGYGNVRLDPSVGDPQIPEQRAEQLLDTLQGLFTPQQIVTIDSQPEPLRAGLILGSPQFQYR
ncbi:MAG: DUF1800 domain-containing protein [Gammaproteobacteria bacterium]